LTGPRGKKIIFKSDADLSCNQLLTAYMSIETEQTTINTTRETKQMTIDCQTIDRFLSVIAGLVEGRA